MSKISEIYVPTVYNVYPKKKRDYPIEPKENLLRALRHEKPLWMPNFMAYFQDTSYIGRGEPLQDGEQFVDMWGVTQQFSSAQASATAISTAFDEVTEWREKLVWPNISEMNLPEKFAGFKRKENRLVTGHIPTACFEQLHKLEGFEQALVDMILETQTCRELFEAQVDFQLEYFKEMHKIFNYEYVIYHDDWGTARGPFFSMELFKEAVLPPSIRLVKEVQKMGVPVMFHCCGLIDAFIPYLVEDIGADGLQIQKINDIKGILQKYGDIVTVEYSEPDPFIMYDKESTSEDIKNLARYVVDNFGAHVNPGAGVVVSISAPTEEIYNCFEDEMYEYSLEKYSKL